MKTKTNAQINPLLRSCLALTGCALLVVIAESQASVIAQYNFGAADSTVGSALSTDADANTAAGDFLGISGTLTLGNVSTSGLHFQRLSTAVSNANGSGTNPRPVLAITTSNGADYAGINSEAAAVSSGKYWQFTITPNAGYKVSFSSLAFDARADIEPHSPTPLNGETATYFVRSSLDSYASTIASGTISGSRVSGNLPWSPVSLGLDALAEASSAVTFRVGFYYSDLGTLSGTSVRADNMVLNGNVTLIPEPALAAVFAAGVSLVLLLRRQQRRAEPSIQKMR